MNQVNDKQIQNYAGRLTDFRPEWVKLGAPNAILKIIEGYTLPFLRSPRSCKMHAQIFSHTERKEMQASINELILKGAIKKVTNTRNQFFSSIFLVPKPDGSKRFIFNLKRLNKFLNVPKFKMEGIHTVKSLMTKNCFMASIDLKDAYYLVSIKPSHRKYLRFTWENTIYEFLCLPFGLASAPLVFTKLMKPVISSLRKQGLLSVVFLDDFLLIGHTYQDCQQNVYITLSTLERLGFVINYKKSCLVPSQRLKYLGFIFDSVDWTVSLPDDKRVSITQMCQKVLNNPRLSIEDLSRVIGTLVAACPAIPYGMLYTKILERKKFKSLNKHGGNYQAKVTLEPSELADMNWWINALPKLVAPITHQPFELEIFSDSSSYAWGGTCKNEVVRGYWTHEEATNHINYLELKAAFLSLKSFSKHIINSSILLRIDNTTAVAYVNRMGSIQFPHLTTITRDIWQYFESKNIWIFASYIASRENCVADFQSRIVDTNNNTEWSLCNHEFKKIVSSFFEPYVDLFAAYSNAKCKCYVSWKADPFSWKVDAFTLCWTNQLFYAFPPFNLVGKVLAKIISDKAEGIVVCPFWSHQSWFPLFNKLLISNLLILGPAPELLLNNNRKHPLAKSLCLMAGILSGKRTDDEG